MNRSKKVIFALTGSLLFISPLTVNASALNKSLDDFSNIISEEIEEISKLDRSPKILVAANKKIKRRLERLEIENERLENMLNGLAFRIQELEKEISELNNYSRKEIEDIIKRTVRDML